MKIGLALGSGAARGWAHIGIIQALEELGINIDVVAGCSIGAYVGAAYTSGKLQPLGEWASSLTEWQVLSLMGVGLRKGGLASGQKVFQVLEEQFSATHFNELDKPFAVVATDLYSGKEVSFTEGAINPAVRASCAIPALFPPSAVDGRWLVDGAVVNPVPVNLCRQLGADFVIAINLSADFRPQLLEETKVEHEKIQQRTNEFFRKSHAIVQQWFKGKDKDDETIDDDTLSDEQELQQMPSSPAPSIIGVMSSSLEILQARVTRSRLAGDPPDILIEPQLRDFGIMEFHRAQELIEEGRRSVARVAEQIKYQLHLD
ncbi:patatin-like phospholipase RssA [Aestuariibacter halophilus]|uniref:Patatin-like phospholipase RssA n=1 Tax=Fluctibacter halophilus TaxID=226011 RepID=A0ABS8G7R1_9ALTE|nr:patatin-like phospholipase RssA [Aestuariibacter halophilus]MCC2615714.1 patatin-like phospholipase RssA [Aestuariibacter halophilus]